MNGLLQEHHLEYQRQWQQFAEKEIVPFARQLEAAHQFPEQAINKLAEEGLLALTIPKQFGGNPQDAVSYALAMMTIAGAEAGVSVVMSVSNMVAEMIVKFGTEEQKKTFLPNLANGSLKAGAFALTESNAGSNPVEMRARAVKGEEGFYTISGEKVFITSGDVAGVVIVFAKTNPELKHKGITAFLVTPDIQGFAVSKKEDKMGLTASSTVSLVFDNMKVHESAILGNLGDGFKIAMTALDSGRIGISSQAAGIAETAYKTALEYVGKNSDHRGLLTNQQSVQFKLADMRSRLQACKLMIFNAARLKDNKEPFTFQASMAKYFVTEQANWIVSEVVNLMGKAGGTDRYIAEKLFRDIRVTTIYEGTSEIQQIVIARKLMEEDGFLF